jgi:hypothetical protein
MKKENAIVSTHASYERETNTPRASLKKKIYPPRVEGEGKSNFPTRCWCWRVTGEFFYDGKKKNSN